MALPKLSESDKQSQSIALALSRLRTAVVLCCCMIGFALCVQLVIWSLAAYTDLRFETNHEPAIEAEPRVVMAESPRQQRIRELREAELGIDLSPEPDTVPTPPQQATGRMDAAFAAIYNLAGGVGHCAMLAILPLMMVSVMLAAGSATPGIDRVVSSLAWALVAAALILPLGGIFHMPWEGGALSSYAQMTSTVDAVNNASATPAPAPSDDTPLGALNNENDLQQINHRSSSLTMHLRFGMLPLACIVGIVLVALRFCSGVEAGIESMRLDPALERETSNIALSSLHTGRGAAVLARTMQDQPKPDNGPSARTVSPGEQPQRLI